MRPAIALLSVALLTACAGTGGLGSAGLTQQLRPGMSAAQVQAVLGPPATVQQGAAGAEWQYSLHQVYKGWVPYVLSFSGQPLRLQAWAADDAAYQRQTQATLKALAPALEALRPAPAGAAYDAAALEACKRRYRYIEDVRAYCR